MKQKHTLTILLLLVSAFILIACQSEGTSSEGAGTAGANIPPVIETSNAVSAEAFVTPLQDVNLAFEAGGRVVEVLVKEGDTVTAGQVIARLDDADAKAAIAVAEAALAQAQAGLAQAKTGATSEQIASAEVAVKRSEAILAQTVAGPRDEDIAVVQARVNTLKAQLQNVQASARPETLTAAMASLKQAENALELAQADYDRIAYAADSEQAQPIALALENATLNYEAARANYNALLNGATTTEVAVVQAQVVEGEVGLSQLLAGTSPEQIAVAQVGVLEAEAALNQVKADPTAEQIAVAEAGVKQAEAALKQARLVLNKLELTASVAGVVTNLNLEAGEIVSPGAPIINIADLSTWRVETDDLTEIDVVKVQEGQAVDVTFDALPNEIFAGKVTRIKPRSELKAGDVTYTVVINLSSANDPRLRWGMTAFVEIAAE